MRLDQHYRGEPFPSERDLPDGSQNQALSFHSPSSAYRASSETSHQASSVAFADEAVADTSRLMGQRIAALRERIGRLSYRQIGEEIRCLRAEAQAYGLDVMECLAARMALQVQPVGGRTIARAYLDVMAEAAAVPPSRQSLRSTKQVGEAWLALVALRLGH